MSLIELLVAIALLIVLVAAVTTVSVGVQRQTPNDVERGQMVGFAESGLSQMARELRSGSAPSGSSLPTSATNAMDLIVPNTTYGTIRVKYDCTVSSTAFSGLHECVRYWSNNTSASPTGSSCPVSSCTSLVIDGVSNNESTTPVFTPNSSSSPTYYTVEIQVPSRGLRSSNLDSYSAPITLTDGIYLRNALSSNRALGGQGDFRAKTTPDS